MYDYVVLRHNSQNITQILWYLIAYVMHRNSGCCLIHYRLKIGKGKLAVSGSAHMFTDQYIAKE